MKILITGYSRTGVTREVCERLSGFLNEIDGIEAVFGELVDRKKRSGALGYVVAGKDACLKKGTEIEELSLDPAEFDLIVIATPVWAFTVTPAVRAFAEKYASSVKKAAFVFTMGGSGDVRACEELMKLLGKEPEAKITFIDRNVKASSQEKYLHPLREFAAQITGQ